MIKVKAAAKINISLDIIKRLENGYHSLFMLMQSVDLYDEISVDLTNDKNISISCNIPDIPTDKSNIAYKAAEAFFKYAKIDNPGISINICKAIPFAAGLAGGSADGAGVIVSLDRLFGTNFSQKQLCDIGITVGADIPFCIIGGTMLAQDIGGVLSPLPELKDVYIVLAKPKAGISTKSAYNAFDTAANVRHPDNASIIHFAANGDYDKVYKYASNVFEQFIEVPERINIKSVMRDNNCKMTCMSGSGPTVFGIFENENDAKKCYEKLSENMDDVYITKPVSNGTIFE